MRFRFSRPASHEALWRARESDWLLILNSKVFIQFSDLRGLSVLLFKIVEAEFGGGNPYALTRSPVRHVSLFPSMKAEYGLRPRLWGSTG